MKVEKRLERGRKELDRKELDRVRVIRATGAKCRATGIGQAAKACGFPHKSAKRQKRLGMVRPFLWSTMTFRLNYPRSATLTLSSSDSFKMRIDSCASQRCHECEHVAPGSQSFAVEFHMRALGMGAQRDREERSFLSGPGLRVRGCQATPRVCQWICSSPKGKIAPRIIQSGPPYASFAPSPDSGPLGNLPAVFVCTGFLAVASAGTADALRACGSGHGCRRWRHRTGVCGGPDETRRRPRGIEVGCPGPVRCLARQCGDHGH